jgi:ppGpp synthetase/RelA/SpoT-type nucleotidyltranferase
MNDYPKKLLEQFQDQRQLYEDFCQVIHKLLSGLLEEGGYKYHMSYRVKEWEALREKLARKQAEGRIFNDLREMEDLAGVRIVFYLESERDRFIRNLFRETQGDLRIEENRKDTGYEAIHISAGLGQKRYELSEYRRFEGMKCEVQLTSVLKHAWAEIEHDIFYKEEAEIRKSHPKQFEKLRKRMTRIMRKHIQKASSEFEDIVAQVSRMKHKD